VDKLIYEDYGRNINNSLIACLFARGVYSEDNIVEALASVGINKTKEELTSIGREIFLAKYQFKKQAGFDLGDIKVPARFFETVSQMGNIKEETITNMIKLYRDKTGV